MRFFDFLKQQLKEPTPLEVISKELAQAHLERLESENATEYAAACLKLSLARIERLNERMKEYKQ